MQDQMSLLHLTAFEGINIIQPSNHIPSKLESNHFKEVIQYYTKYQISGNILYEYNSIYLLIILANLIPPTHKIYLKNTY